MIEEIKQAMILAEKQTMKIGDFLMLMDCFPVPEEIVCEEMLNECYEPVKVCGYEYEQGSLLKAIDPVAFRQAVLDYFDSMVSDGEMQEIDGNYYHTSDINEMIERIEKEYA